jgi:alpha-L-fucosidase
MKLGFYYSQDQDWCNGGSVIGKKWDKAQEHDMDDYINKIAVPQVKEILGRYGEFPAVLWWDTPHAITPAQAHKLDQIVHELKPNIIMNNRLGGGIKGDTETPEQYIPVNGFPGKDWETCMTMNGTWGFKSNDHKWKSTQTLIKNVCEILSKGGNFLLNVGPTSEGVIPYQSRMRLRQVGAWVAKNQEAVYGTQAGPFLAASDWGFASSKNGLLYLYITKWPANNQLVVPLENPSGEAWPLLNSQQKLTVTRGKHSLSVDVSKVSEEDYATVLVLDLHAKTLPAPIPPKPALAQSADGRVVLTSSDAQIIGERLNNSTMEDITALRFWEKASDYASWKFLVHQPGTFSVKARYAVSPNHAGSTFAIRVGGQKLTQVLESTDGWENYRDLDMGRVTINKSGTSTVRAELVKLAAGAGLNLQSVTLTPVR